MEEILRELACGKITVEEAAKTLKINGIKEIGDIARLDTGRWNRRGVPEIILASGKESTDVADLSIEMAKEQRIALVSRMNDGDIDAIDKAIRGEDLTFEYNKRAKMAVIRQKDHNINFKGKIGIITAGTSDIRAAEEAKVVASTMDCEVITSYDLGVAGIHRLFDPLRMMMEADVEVIIVAAGMEGALPSVVASVVDVPVIGLPTSIGYGAGGKGIAALLSMLQSCSGGVAVVNIDNGIGAGIFAALIARKAHRR
ncbi:MAG: N5-carboxyaminoimidazole ribonucleotide mutase [Candidatus Syntrophoarchaeum sp. GoM_oil]|nr:MAG: N5-carboxyaminoimidazole ribonucleotide mutase [Candidatus Syntrophoarchaeum sp. GoM_oil]